MHFGIVVLKILVKIMTGKDMLHQGWHVIDAGCDCCHPWGLVFWACLSSDGDKRAGKELSIDHKPQFWKWSPHSPPLLWSVLSLQRKPTKVNRRQREEKRCQLSCRRASNHLVRLGVVKATNIEMTNSNLRDLSSQRGCEGRVVHHIPFPRALTRPCYLGILSVALKCMCT